MVFCRSLVKFGGLRHFRTQRGTNMKRFNTILFATALIIGYSGVSSAGALIETSTMHLFKDASVIDGTEASLTRLDGGLHIAIDTVGLTAGHAVTAWFVIFNKPGSCSDGECGENDIFNLDGDGKFILNADGSNPMNFDGIETSNISVHRAAGLIIDVDGKASFLGSLVVGDVSDAVFGGGLVDANAAEVHIVLVDHQATIPGSSDVMVNTITGGCSDVWPNEPCKDIQFAVFKPAS